MKRIALIYSLLLFLLPHAFSRESSTEKKLTKEWQVKSGSTLTFNAKYQDVQIVFWNENKVKLDITVNSNTDKVSPQDLIDRIELTSENEGINLSVSLRLKPDKNNSVWNWVFGSNSKKIDVSINSTLYVPNSLGALAIVSSYSDIKAAIIPMPLTLNAKYGDVNIDELQKNGNITSSYSDIKIEKAGDLEVNSNYGDLNIQSADYVKITSSYADIVIAQLNKSFICNTTYGDVEISDLAKTFSSIKCSGVYSDYIIGMNDNNPVQFDIHSRYGDIIRKGLQVVNVQEDESNGGSMFKGKTKSAGSSAPVILINSTYGQISLVKN
jgi:hypothetical protein